MQLVPVVDIPVLTEDQMRLSFSADDRIINLNEKATPYTSLYGKFLEMRQLCIDTKGVGLSAVQIGEPFPLFIAHIGEEPQWRYFLNCEYASNSVKRQSMEGCLSLQDGDRPRYFLLERYEQIKVIGKEMVDNGETLDIIDVAEEFHGFDAVVMQHEIDHQNNILISDLGKEIIPRRFT